MRTDISVAVDAPPQRVWQVLSDVDRWPQWTPSVTSVRRLDDEPLRVGSRVRVDQPRLPPALWQVTELTPERSFTWVSTGPGLRVVATHTVEATGTGSVARLAVEQRGPLGVLVGRLTRRLSRRYLQMEAAGLKRRSEQA